MKLIKCKDCGQMKSQTAGRCPHCGARHDYGSYAWAFVLACGVAAIMEIIFSILK